MRMLSLAFLALASCTEHNPASCCTSPLQCANLGLNEMYACDGLAVCSADGTCVPPECETSADCHDADKPLCENQVCVATCTDDSQCSAATPHCSSTGTCVECTESGQCPSGDPVCDQSTNTCVMAPPECVPELIFVRGNPAFGLLQGQLFYMSPTDLVEHAIFTDTTQSEGAYSRSKLAWIESDQKLWVGDADGTNPVMIDDVSANSTFTAISNVRWSPDGTHLAYQIFPVGHGEQSHIWVSDLNTSPVNITSNAQADSPEWSPDGTKIAFESNRAGNYDIFTMHADGTNQTNLTASGPLSTRDQEFPLWSPDGNTLLYEGPINGTTSFGIWTINADGSMPAAITSPLSGQSDTAPRWITNDQVVYGHSAGGNDQLYLSSTTGTNQHGLSASASGQETSMPSPDGKYIVWSENDSGQNTQLWFTRLDTVSPTRITNSIGLNNTALGWRACPYP
ncbi:MAG: hypothetical protein QM831_26045 [Kofleriaceae bacterium]